MGNLFALNVGFSHAINIMPETDGCPNFGATIGSACAHSRKYRNFARYSRVGVRANVRQL